MTLLMKLKNIYSEHKLFYITGILLIIISNLISLIFPHLEFLMFFISFSGICICIYALLLHMLKSHNCFIRTISRIMQITALTLITIFILSQVYIQYKIISSSKSQPNECDYLIILGGGIKDDQPTLVLKYRLNTALEYLRSNQDTKAILSGGLGNGEKYTEAYVMKNYLINNGIDENRLILEEISTDTTENIKYSKQIIDSIEKNEKSPSICIVTSDFHIYRSIMIAKKYNFERCSALPAPTPNVPFLHLNLHLREYFSIILEYLGI